MTIIAQTHYQPQSQKPAFQGRENPTLKLTLTNEISNEKARQVLLFCYSACRVDDHALGWLPKSAYDHRHQSGNLLALWNNDDLVAFTMFFFRNTECKIYQIWVRQDARQILHTSPNYQLIAQPTFCARHTTPTQVDSTTFCSHTALDSHIHR